MKTKRVSRVIHILTALQSAQHYTIDDLSKMLRVGRRTVFRDLKDLRKAGVPCYYDNKTCSYAIDSKFFLPAPDLNVQETLGLLLLVHKARNHIHLPFKDSMLRAALKIENSLPAKIKRFCNRALNNISIKADLQAPVNVSDKIFVQLIEAILKKKIASIRYYSPCKRKSTVIDLNPYHLLYNEYSWYVVGKSGLYKEFCAFELYRIKELNISYKRFIKDEKFDVHEYLGRAWSMIREGKLYHIKLRFLPEVAHNVSEVQWHSTQRVVFENDGSAIVEFRVDGLNEIIWWVLSYGDKVQVLAPKTLRQKIIKITENTLKQNRQLSSIW